MREFAFTECKGKQKKSNYKKCDSCEDRFKCWTSGYPTDTNYVVDDVSLVSGNGDILMRRSFSPVVVESGDTIKIEFNLTFRDGEWKEVK